MGIIQYEGDEGLYYTVNFILWKEELMQWRKISMLDSFVACMFKEYLSEYLSENLMRPF